MLTVISVLGLVIVGIGEAYLWALAIASIRTRQMPASSLPRYHFAIAIPAHNEEPVIEDTIHCIRSSNYPPHLYDIYVVADHCTDRTAEMARRAGASLYERQDFPAKSKGAALNWLLEHIWATGKPYEAVVFLDADSRPDVDFLRHMNDQLNAGELAVQGRCMVSNPLDAWYPALNSALEIVDGRLQQTGRSNLGLSARLSGFGFCAHSSVVKSSAWPTGLTEDYEFRLRILEKGIRICYEPRAIVRAEAPASWEMARHQHVRWRAGVYESGRRYLAPLLRQAFQRRNPAVLDAALHVALPSYSTLTVLSVAVLLLQLAANLIWGPLVPLILILLWASAIVMLALYPFLGLALDRAPLWAYLVIMTGPVFIVWRTWLALLARFGRRSVSWVRTPRRDAR